MNIREEISFVVNFLLWIAFTIAAIAYTNNIFLWGCAIILTILLSEREILVRINDIQENYITFLVAFKKIEDVLQLAHFFLPPAKRSTKLLVT